ncbi:LamG-like jellyroll fold domain-containing protein [Sphingomonas sp.]|uniref:LamG-like jellyroll fold domain-containing protein n=1 Tax=Sphingomonas sp. TaxID=28214 RepID=UPI002FD92DE2
MPVITVTNQAQLDAAMKAAKGGDTILLAAGNYTGLSTNNFNPTSNLTIQSLDDKNPAVLKSLSMISSSNVTLKNLNFVQDYRPAQDYETANRVMNSKNIVIDGVRFSGGTGDASNSLGIGLTVRGGSNVKLLNSSIDHFAVGLNGMTVDNMVIQNNNFHDNRRDHTNFAEMSDLVIDSNYFTALYPINGEHPDAIQFMTAGRTKGNTNITISNNIIMQGDGRASQGIFLGEEAGNLWYQNVDIKNNLLYVSGMYNGIAMLNGNNVNIDSNSVISDADGTSFWIRLRSVNGAVTNNVADDIVLDGSNNVTQSGNVVLSRDPAALRKIVDINMGSKARVAGLLVDGVGYKPPVGSAAAALVAQQQLLLPKSTGGRLLLDLNFTPTGMVDYSTWSSDETSKPVNLASISNGMYKIATGAGIDLARANSRQLFGLSAFTLNFNMKRDGVTAPAGQIMGVFLSWNVSLRADGELSFSMTNTAGKTFTLTTSGAKILDTNNHKIALTYDSTKGTAALYVDGSVKGTAAMSGTMLPPASQPVYLGNPFGAAFSGYLGDIEMRDAALSAAEIVALNTSTVPDTTTAANMLKTMVAKGVADSAATLAATTNAWGGALTAPSTLSLAGAFKTTSATSSPLAALLANTNAIGALPTTTGALSTFGAPRVYAYDLNHV